MSFERMRCSFSLSLTDPRMRRHAHLARPLAVYHFDMNLAWPFLMSDIASREERERELVLSKQGFALQRVVRHWESFNHQASASWSPRRFMARSELIPPRVASAEASCLNDTPATT
jgi:hypothetical protein